MYLRNNAKVYVTTFGAGLMVPVPPVVVVVTGVKLYSAIS